MPGRIVSPSLVLILGCLGGCASRQPVGGNPVGHVPIDFTIDAAVISGGRGEETRSAGEIVPAELRSGRFVVFPNGDLHYAAGDVRSNRGRPPITRRLSRDDLASLWSLCGQSGLVAAPPFSVSEAGDVHPDSGEVVYIITLNVNGEYRGVAQVYDRSTAPDSAEGAIFRELAALAWANEMPAERTLVIPKRYDFGPDPYERYRDNE